MSNLSDNRLNATLTEGAVSRINAAIDEITGNLPEGNLTEIERMRLFSLDVANRVFVEEVLTEMETSGAGIIPPFIKKEHIETDLALFKQMNTLETKLQGLLRQVSNLKRLSGHEAYGAALAVYKIYQAANASGISSGVSSYTNLKPRFEAQNKPKPETEL